jgi:hypothetical protein
MTFFVGVPSASNIFGSPGGTEKKKKIGFLWKMAFVMPASPHKLYVA